MTARTPESSEVVPSCQWIAGKLTAIYGKVDKHYVNKHINDMFSFSTAALQ